MEEERATETGGDWIIMPTGGFNVGHVAEDEAIGMVQCLLQYHQRSQFCDVSFKEQ